MTFNRLKALEELDKIGTDEAIKEAKKGLEGLKKHPHVNHALALDYEINYLVNTHKNMALCVCKMKNNTEELKFLKRARHCLDKLHKDPYVKTAIQIKHKLNLLYLHQYELENPVECEEFYLQEVKER